MSVHANSLFDALRRSPFWNSPKDLCACSILDQAGILGLDLIWYFREFRAELREKFSVQAIATHYLSNAGNNLHSPNMAFDEFWYRQRYLDADEAVKTGHCTSGWQHYLQVGADKGYNPAFWFDERWYTTHDMDAAIALKHGDVCCAFEHYLRSGVYSDKMPSMYFNPDWYRREYLSGDSDRRVPIVDYLRHKRGKRPAPVPFFDTDWYKTQYLNTNGSQRDISPFEHYVLLGRSRGYSASPHFNEAAYRARYPDVSAAISKGVYASGLEHYAAEGLVNGYVAQAHLSLGALDYVSPPALHNYEASIMLNTAQVAKLRHLLSIVRGMQPRPVPE